MIFLPSCKKVKKDCWDCTLYETRITGPYYTNPTYNQTNFVYCDKTPEEITEIVNSYHHDGNQYRSNMECAKRE